MIEPIAQNICNIWVAGARSLMGTISLQYAGALAIKIPHGIPSRIWAATITDSELAKKKTKIKALRSLRPPIVAQRYPMRLVIGQAIVTPIRAPTGPQH